MTANIRDLDREWKRLSEMVRADRTVLAVIVYGSRARGEGKLTSDLDVCLVLYPANYSRLDLSRKKLEYLEFFNLDVQIHQQLPIYIRTKLLREGKTLRCRDEDILYQVACRTV